jgi:hypothetical protein
MLVRFAASTGEEAAERTLKELKELTEGPSIRIQVVIRTAPGTPASLQHSSPMAPKGVTMGTDKDRQFPTEDNWDLLARDKGFRCSLCGAPTAYGERELYFRTGMCGNCATTRPSDTASGS